jgi:UDP-glucose 4-epimerase
MEGPAVENEINSKEKVNMLKGRVLITGGAGLIGSHIVDQLTREDVSEIVILDNFVRGRRENLAWALAHGPVTIVEGDIRDRRLLADIMHGIDVVFHQAAIRITQCAEDPRLALDVLGVGTFNLLEAAVKARVKKVVAASSASIYGSAEEFPTPEFHHPYNDRTFYGATKTYNEGMLRSFHEMYGLDYVALRYWNVYGPRMDIYGAYTEVFIRWMERIAAGQPPLIFGDGTQTMDLIFVEDVARANILGAQAEVSDGVFNVASGAETSVNDVANILLRIMGADLRPEYGPARTVNLAQRRLADVSKAQRMLGFEAQVSVEDGLGRLVAWWRKERVAKQGFANPVL